MSSVIAPTKKKKRSDKFDKLIGPTDTKIDALARERLISARVGLLLRHSFFGNLATRLVLENADDWLQTAATDGLRLYYNSRFIKKLQQREVEFLIGHEVLHIVYDHFGRRDNRDPKLWNIANDYAVNADLKKHNVGEFITSVPCLYEKQYENKSSEEIYEILYKNAEKIDLNSLLDQLLDDHLDDQSGEGENDGNGEPKNGKGRPKLTPEEREQIRQELKGAIINAARSAGSGTTSTGTT
jgi:predicted metal-dependent peptidase